MRVTLYYISLVSTGHKLMKISKLLSVVTLLAGVADAAGYRAGVARRIITPDKPIYLSGYGNRNRPSEGKASDLWAKALALDDGRGNRLVIVAVEVVGLPRSITEVIAARAAKDYRLQRSQLLLNFSHTHTGPLIRGNLEMMFELTPEESAVVGEYSRKLADDLVELIGLALKDLAPAQLSFGNGTGAIAINRREHTPKGVRLGLNPKGPSDHDVPVLKVTAPDGTLRAVVFGYACHNTTLGGDFYKISGDYSGYAQEGVENANPGSTAMFLQLCGGDQNPNPRLTLDIAARHGASLAAEVNRVLIRPLQPVNGRIRSVFQVVDLEFAFHTREKFEELLKTGNKFQQRNARLQLKAYDDGRPVRRYPYPVQGVAFGQDLVLVALGGEVVVDYALRIKKEYGDRGIIVAGYSNDVMSYIPSLRVLKEGGYEPVDSMTYYGQPGPYNEEVEDRVMGAVHNVMKRLKRKKL